MIIIRIIMMTSEQHYYTSATYWAFQQATLFKLYKLLRQTLLSPLYRCINRPRGIIYMCIFVKHLALYPNITFEKIQFVCLYTSTHNLSKFRMASKGHRMHGKKFRVNFRIITQEEFKRNKYFFFPDDQNNSLSQKIPGQEK